MNMTVNIEMMRMLKYSALALSVILSACTSPPEHDAEGTFEATEITVSAEGTGQLLSFDLEAGDNVTKGMKIGLIDTLQLSLQRRELQSRKAALLNTRPDISAQVAATREQIAGTRTERDRVERLLAEGAATKQQLDQLNTRLAALEGQLKGQLSTLESNTSGLNKQAAAIDAQLAAIEDKIGKCIIASPLSGTILDTYVEAGEVTAFGKPLFRMADLQRMFLRAYFTSDQLADIGLGQKVKVVADYGGGKEKTYDGTIVYIAAESEFTPKTIQTKDTRANLVYAVKIAVENDGLIKIGQSGCVYVGDKSE